MGKVTTGGTMSLDGYIAGPEESGFDLLFQWYGNGDVEIPSASPDVPPPRISAASAELIKQEWDDIGALVVGRHLYDMTNAWGGRHPMNVTTVVLTHRRPDDRPGEDENFVFVTGATGSKSSPQQHSRSAPSLATSARSSCRLECVGDHNDTVAERTSCAVLEADVQARTQEQILRVSDAGERGVEPQM